MHHSRLHSSPVKEIIRNIEGLHLEDEKEQFTDKSEDDETKETGAVSIANRIPLS